MNLNQFKTELKGNKIGSPRGTRTHTTSFRGITDLESGALPVMLEGSIVYS